MNKRFLILGGSLLAAVALGWLAVRWFNHRAEFTPAVSDKEIVKARQRLFPGAPTQPEVAPVAQLPASRKVRLAIGALGSPDDAQNANLADLLTAELTGAKGLDLVERKSLDRALRELELSRSGLVRAKDAVRVGHLVHADWFLLGARHHAGAAGLLVLRLVDARTGILRDVTVLPAGNDVTRTASEAGQFVRQNRQAASAKDAQPRLLLAIGGFADVGVNNRQAAFPDQLRSYLTMAYRNSAVTLLERDSIAVLLEEVHLDLAGLADEATGPIPPLQSAFWLVDGCFQSYETAGQQVEVVLRISRIFSRSTSVTLRGPPDETFFHKIKDTVDAAIAKGNRQLVVPTRRSEIAAQMNTGKELFAIATGGHHIELPVPSFGGMQSYPQRVFDLKEAIRCFQAVMALDPTNRQAKFYVAACLLDRSMNSLEEARNAYRELASSEIHDNWACQAAWTLAASYRGQDDREAAKWYLKASELGPQKFFAGEASNALADAFRHEAVETGHVSTQAMALAEMRLFQGGDEVAGIVRGKGSGHLDYSFGLDTFLAAYGTNVQAGLKRVAELLPSLIDRAPDMEPYLLACAAACQRDTNTPVVAQFRKSLAFCREHPETITNAHFYFDQLLSAP